MRRKAGSRDEEDGAGALEIEFEDDEASSGSGASQVGRTRDLRPAVLTTLGVVVLAAALSATHHGGSRAASNARDENIRSITLTAPDYAAFMVTVQYQRSRVVSLPQRRIAVDLRITPVAGARVSILSYYVSENGVVSAARPVASGQPLPDSGAEAELELTVANCAVVPIGESMGFVNVVADGPAGVTDRFTILGERYASDLARLLVAVCPGRAGGS